MAETLGNAVDALGVPLFRMPSGAGHDAMKLHEIMPQAMLFVRGMNAGISHNPLESTTSDDMQLSVDAFSTCSTNWLKNSNDQYESRQASHLRRHRCLD
jgi:acetylornithine deacetylase/succinyl-diaminopimelate desuccinylase-like protein